MKMKLFSSNTVHRQNEKKKRELCFPPMKTKKIWTVSSLSQFLKQFVHSGIQRWLKSDEKREWDVGVLRLAPLYDEVKAVFCSL